MIVIICFDFLFSSVFFYIFYKTHNKMRHSSSLTSRPPTFNVVRVEINKVAVALHSLSCYYNQTEVNGGMKEIKMIMKVSSSFHKKNYIFSSSKWWWSSFEDWEKKKWKRDICCKLKNIFLRVPWIWCEERNDLIE
jgi:hypothetical protein